MNNYPFGEWSILTDLASRSGLLTMGARVFVLIGLRHLKKWVKWLVVGSSENVAITELVVKHGLHRDLDLTHRLARSAYSLARPNTSVWNSRDNFGELIKSASLNAIG